MKIKAINPRFADLHIHTFYSRDSNLTISQIVKKALKKGLKTIGISDHNPYSFNFQHCGIHLNKLQERFDYIKKGQEKYKNKIKILNGLEMDYFPNQEKWIDKILNFHPDYTLGSIHFVGKDENKIPWPVDMSLKEIKSGLKKYFDNDIKKLCQKYYSLIQQMARLQKFDIVGHFDLIKKFNKNSCLFSDKESWYQNLVEETLNIIAKSKMYLEINTSGFSYPVKEQYPANWIIKKCQKKNIPLVLGSDSHKQTHIARHFDQFTSFV